LSAVAAAEVDIDDVDAIYVEDNEVSVAVMAERTWDSVLVA
jgi:hypothetical protein